MDSADDLADLITPHWSGDAGPRVGLSGSGAGMRYTQGTVLQWNPETGENLVLVDTVPMENLPLIGSTDILVVQPGDQVAILEWAPGGGSGAWWITGRIVVPGTDAATRSIEFMRGALASQIAAEVLAARIHTDVNPGEAIRTSATYGDPSSGGVGPMVANVEISKSGTAVVLLGGLMRSSTGSSFTTEETGYMSVEISGATSVDPSDVNSAYLHATVVDSTAQLASQTVVLATVGRVIEFDGVLNEGVHTFTAKYRRGSGHDSVYVYNRSLVVFAL